MNIFRILSSYDGTINEPNVSSFLAYLLDHNEDHGISSFLLQEILNDIVKSNNQSLSKIQINNKIADLSRYSGYSINIIQELIVFPGEGGKKSSRDIDIIVEVIENKSNNVIYSICIENKINDGSIDKKDSQLEDELKGLKNYYSENEVIPEIYVVYLTLKPTTKSSDSFDKLEYENKHHLYWINPENHERSIFNKLLKIFEYEQLGLIDPINNQSSFIIKSFLSFINTEFKNYLEEKSEKKERKSYGKPVIDLLNEFSKSLSVYENYNIDSLKEDFSKYVKDVSGHELVINTRNAHFILSIVNERNRGHYRVSPNDDRKNIFYYPDISNKKIVRLFDINKNPEVPVYFRREEDIEKVLAVDII